MTKLQLLDLFTFPSGVDKNYAPRQDAVENGFYHLYEAAGLEVPRVFYFKSPLALQMALNYLLSGRNELEVEHDFLSAYPTFANACNYNEVSNRSRNRFFWEYVSTAVAAKGSNHIKDALNALGQMKRCSHLSATINRSLEGDLKKRLAIKGMETYDTARHPNFSDISWLLLHRNHLEKMAEESKNIFLQYHDLVRSGVMHAYLLEGAVLWCPLPTALKINDLKQLHCSDGPALQWNDGYGLYFWNGTKVRKRIIEMPETITRLDVLEEPDPEIRKCIQQRMGIRKYASLFKLVEVDMDRDPHGNEQHLWRTSHIDEFAQDYLYFAEFTTPESVKKEFLEVPSGMTNVWEAIAWSIGNDIDNRSKAIQV